MSALAIPRLIPIRAPKQWKRGPGLLVQCELCNHLVKIWPAGLPASKIWCFVLVLLVSASLLSSFWRNLKSGTLPNFETACIYSHVHASSRQANFTVLHSRQEETSSINKFGFRQIPCIFLKFYAAQEREIKPPLVFRFGKMRNSGASGLRILTFNSVLFQRIISTVTHPTLSLLWLSRCFLEAHDASLTWFCRMGDADEVIPFILAKKPSEYNNQANQETHEWIHIEWLVVETVSWVGLRGKRKLGILCRGCVWKSWLCARLVLFQKLSLNYQRSPC